MPKEKSKRKEKENTVHEVSELIKNSSTIGIVELRNLPDRQLQKIKKALRGNATFKVLKNTLIKKAFEKAGIARELIEKLDGPTAVIFTNMNPFKLYKMIKQNKGKAAAKPGQTAPFDIIVPAGETSLPPGPALSELKAGGIDARIQNGKVVVGKESVVAKQGERVSPNAAKALQQLGIEPIEVGMSVSAVWEEIRR